MEISFYKLKNKILSDRYNSVVFDKGRDKHVYLVGGYIRNILRGVTSPDRDYIVSEDIQQFAREIIESIGGTAVEFKKNHIVRIAFKDGTTLDFSNPAGTIEEDLSKRDFTINAIAWSPDTGIIDPFGGAEDIKKKKIRSLSMENLTADPLRMLRAYRFAAELNGTIKKSTRETVKKLCKRIKKVSPERITLELFNLLNSAHPSKYLKLALSDRLLKAILSFTDNVLKHNIKAISNFETRIKRLPLKVKVQLEKVFSQNLTYKGLLCLELLLTQGRLEPWEIPTIKMSNKVIKRIMLVMRGAKKLEEGRLFEFFMESKEAAQDILILKDRIDLLKESERFKKIWKKGLLSSEEIAAITKIQPGPKLGRVIIKFKSAQFERKIKSKNAAIHFLYNLT